MRVSIVTLITPGAGAGRRLRPGGEISCFDLVGREKENKKTNPGQSRQTISTLSILVMVKSLVFVLNMFTGSSELLEEPFPAQKVAPDAG